MPAFLVLLTALTPLAAQAPDPAVPAGSGEDTISLADRFWLSGQANVISQYHPSFYARYSGPNSLRDESERATSRVLTMFAGVRPLANTEILFDVESAGGGGLSDALGMAGFTNLDVVRNPTLGQAPYVARIMLHQTIPLSKEYQAVPRGPFNLASRVPVRRLEFHVGKMSTVDFFDVNAIGSDSHLQFLNWAADNNAAYDYAADTRGYTFGFVAEYFDKDWAFRFGEMLMPKVANGIDLDWNLARARGENFEFELHPQLVKDRATVLRLLSFVNHAAMGSYRMANQAYSRGDDPAPDVTAHRRQGRVKYGFGANAEQELTADLRAFARFSWNEGHNESFAYTEADQALSLGADLRGSRWKRPRDTAGVALLVNAISGDHRSYLALGGLGFLLGDGGLTYGREKIAETYYNFHLWRGASVSLDLQRVINPGYNRDRGPAWVAGVRFHIEDSLASLLERSR